MKASRRQFVIYSASSVAALAVAGKVAAQPAVLQETDAQAVALGYKADATKVDKAKYAKYQAGQVCSNCNFYKDTGNNMGTCTVIPNKLVAGSGWCNLWVKKAG